MSDPAPPRPSGWRAPDLVSFLPDLPEQDYFRTRLRELDCEATLPTGRRANDGPPGGDSLEDVLTEAGSELLEDARALHEGYSRVLRAAARREHAVAIGALVEMGDREFERNRLERARAFFEAALARARPLRERDSEILALRRLGRVLLQAGRLEEALRHYRRSALLAADVGAVREEVISRTGAANALAALGRWEEAEKWYGTALERIHETDMDLALQQAQIQTNLAMVCKNLGRFEEAEAWLERSRPLVDEAESPLDAALRLHGLAEIRSRQGRLAEARELCHRAVGLESPPYFRALFLDDLAAYHLADGLVSEARGVWREGEAAAMASRSPYALAAVYRTLGNLRRSEGDEESWVVYERALEIARESGYRSLEVEILLDYARQRDEIGEAEEAEEYREHARQILREMAIVEEEVRRRVHAGAAGHENDPNAVLSPGGNPGGSAR